MQPIDSLSRNPPYRIVVFNTEPRRPWSTLNSTTTSAAFSEVLFLPERDRGIEVGGPARRHQARHSRH